MAPDGAAVRRAGRHGSGALAATVVARVALLLAALAPFPAPSGLALATGGATLTLSTSGVPATGSLDVAFNGGTGASAEWVAIYPSGSAGAGGYLDWVYTSGSRSSTAGAASGTLTFPTTGVTLPAGDYVARWISAGSVIAESPVFTVFTPPAPTLSTAAGSVPPTGPIDVTFANGSGASAEYIGLYPSGSVGAGGYVDWVYTSGSRSSTVGAASGTVTFPTLGVTLASGDYVARWVSGGGVIAESGVFTVVTPPPTLSVSPQTIGVGGSFTVTFGNGSGASAEWVGLYPAGSSGSGGYVDWLYTSGSRASTAGAVSGTLLFPSPGVTLAPGDYVSRWIAAGSIVAESSTFTVADPPPVPALNALTPHAVTVGASAFTLQVLGSGFTAASVVHLDAVSRPTVFVDPGELQVTIEAVELDEPGSFAVTVVTPALAGQGGGTSQARTFTIWPPGPTPAEIMGVIMMILQPD